MYRYLLSKAGKGFTKQAFAGMSSGLNLKEHVFPIIEGPYLSRSTCTKNCLAASFPWLAAFFIQNRACSLFGATVGGIP
jgi:hypothetical protein